MTRLKDHHALITGGGTGIGAAIARRLADEGAKLTLVGRRREPLEKVASEIRSPAKAGAQSESEAGPRLLPGNIVVAPADVTERAEVDAAFAAARAANGPITILVNNAGAAAATPFAKVTPETWRATMAVNLDALLHCCQAALPDLIAAPSARIVTISSIAGLKGAAYIAPYVAAKHGAVGLTRALAAEYAKTNLTVDAVCPGFTDTDIVAKSVENIAAKTGRDREQARAALTKFNPQGRLIDPAEVANAVWWLCLEESRSITGQAIAVAGGGNLTLNPERFEPAHFGWGFEDGVATVMLNRPERKNPLTFESYAELRDLFRALVYTPQVKAVVVTGAGGNFSSGGDVHEIIGPLTEMEMPGLLAFTRMTGDLVKAMRACPQPIVAALHGVCVGAGAIVAMASDLRLATAATKTAFLFTRVGLAGCDMGACAILPRIIGQGRASELLFTGRVMTAEEGERWGFHNRLVESDRLLDEAQSLARDLATGPTFAHGITKTQLNTEWAVSLETAIEMEAQAQAICMATNDFRRAFEAFAAKRTPEFKGD